MNEDLPVKILLVDDQPSNLFALEALLEDLGHTLTRAGSGEEALKRLLQEDFALILLDVFMPGLDGFETAALIRQRERSRHTPIIFLTAIGKDDNAVFRGYSVGAVDYLFKPLMPEILRAKVRVFVDLFRKTREIQRQTDELRVLAHREHEARLSEARQRWAADRLRADMRVAREIQQMLFPPQPPECPGFEIAGVSLAAEMAGGDYFDYFPLPDGSVGVAIGDVSGHGVGPALLMAETRACLRTMALMDADLSRILALANRLLTNDTQEHFVTLLFGRLDSRRRRLHYVNAGHIPGYMLGPSGDVKAVLESTEMPLGILDDERPFPAAEADFEPGDTLLLLTDGIIEANSPDDVLFGIERALNAVRACLDQPAVQIIEALCQAVLQFAAQPLLRDDMTVIVLKANPRATEPV